MNFFTTPSSKNIIVTLRIVTIEMSELTLLLILYFHGLHISEMKSLPGMEKNLFTHEFHPGMKFNLKENL